MIICQIYLLRTSVRVGVVPPPFLWFDKLTILRTSKDKVEGWTEVRHFRLNPSLGLSPLGRSQDKPQSELNVGQSCYDLYLVSTRNFTFLLDKNKLFVKLKERQMTPYMRIPIRIYASFVRAKVLQESLKIIPDQTGKVKIFILIEKLEIPNFSSICFLHKPLTL